MSPEARYLSIDQIEQIRSFYADYACGLDDGRFDQWPNFFTDDCIYQIMPAENYAQGLPLCTMQADSKGMLLDRVQGILKTQKFGPRTCRRFYSALKLTPSGEAAVTARQNVLVVQTLIDEPSTILLCGVAHDQLMVVDGCWRFQRRIVASDTEVLQEALIFPV
jgi:salicylate 5-hydroxylase small subunit